MAKQIVTITFVVAPDIEAVYAELDDDRNDDKTQFVYDEKAYFKVFTTPANLSINLTSTDGSITFEGNGEEDIEELLVFTETEEGEENQVTVTRPITSLISTDWLGNSLGALSVEENVITASLLGIGVCKVTYRTSFRRYALYLSERDEDTYTVIVLIRS